MAQTQALERMLKILLDELPLKQAVALAVKLTGKRRIWFMKWRWG
jgi:hypothetical protein